MANVRKFLFDTSFDAPPAPDEPDVDEAEDAAPEPEPPPPPPPTFSQEEMAEARAEAQAAGREEGLNEATAGIERRAASALEAVDTRLGLLAETQAAANAAVEREAVAVALAVARKMLPELAARNALAEVSRAVEEALALIREEPRVTVRVAPDLVEALEARLTEAAGRGGFAGRVTVAGDPAIGGADCRIDWVTGGAERDAQALWNEIDAIVVRNLGQPQGAPEPAAEPESEPDPVTAPDPEPDPNG